MARLDADLPLYDVQGLESVLEGSVARRRTSLRLLGSFAVAALLLAGIGIYGVMAYTVSQRTHEIGIRMALGARPTDVLRLVVRQGAVLASVGILLGLVSAWALTRWMSNLLFGIGATDPATFGGTALLIGGVAVLACYLPARRAASVDPMVVLRHE